MCINRFLQLIVGHRRGNCKFNHPITILILSILVLVLYFLYSFHWSQKKLFQYYILDEVSNTSSKYADFEFTINEIMRCSREAPFLVMLVTSHPSESNTRHAIRSTWGGVREVYYGKEQLVGVLTLFLLGIPASMSVQAAVETESRVHKDIVQQNFVDSYRNLTLKVLMGMRWVSRYCPRAKYVLKTDSDMFVNVDLLVTSVLQPGLPPRTKYFAGHYFEATHPHRNPSSKWYLSRQHYRLDFYPPYCSGTAYTFSSDLSAKILQASQNLPLLPLEDVYIGLCLNWLGVHPLSNSLFHIKHINYSPCRYKSLVSSHGVTPDKLLLYWKGVQGAGDLHCDSVSLWLKETFCSLWACKGSSM
uniref:Hexosyltransferase n=1 Tax=Eptatretus burgeri TaxID=7764 RepID=A0A8C4QWM5_EPTBU